MGSPPYRTAASGPAEEVQEESGTAAAQDPRALPIRERVDVRGIPADPVASGSRALACVRPVPALDDRRASQRSADRTAGVGAARLDAVAGGLARSARVRCAVLRDGDRRVVLPANGATARSAERGSVDAAASTQLGALPHHRVRRLRAARGDDLPRDDNPLDAHREGTAAATALGGVRLRRRGGADVVETTRAQRRAHARQRLSRWRCRRHPSTSC